MTLADNKWPEANLLIELRLYALQHHTHYKYDDDVSLSMLAEYWLVAN
jgi:hypothetical protein